MGEREYFGHGRLFAEDLSSALIIKFPGNRYSNTHIRSRVRLMDIMPTIFDFLRINDHSFEQGISFLGVIKGMVGSYQPLLLSYSGDLRHILLFGDKFVYSDEPQEGWTETLFDIYSDPPMRHNLALEQQEALASMRAKCQKIFMQDRQLTDRSGCNKRAPVVLDEETLAALRSLGYMQ